MQGSRIRVQESEETISFAFRAGTGIFTLVLILCLSPFTFHLSPTAVHAAEYSFTEARIIQFVKEIYGPGEDVQVRLNNIPNQLKENVRVRSITFARIPDQNGDGICAVELEGMNGRSRSLQVPFRVFTKRKLFVLKEAARKDDLLTRNDLYVKETYMNGKGPEYPAAITDVAGKVMKRDMPANTIVTCQMLEESVAIQKGEIVNIVAESKHLLVQSKGRTIDKGRLGDIVRVKNTASGKEVTGRVTAQNTVKVDF